MKRQTTLTILSLFLLVILAGSAVAIPDWLWPRNTTYTVDQAGVKNASYICFKDGQCFNSTDLASAGSGDITAVNTPVTNDYIYNGSTTGDVNLRFNESRLNATITALASGGGSQWAITYELQNESGSLGVNDTWLHSQTLNSTDTLNGSNIGTGVVNIAYLPTAGGLATDAELTAGLAAQDSCEEITDCQNLTEIVANTGNWSADSSSYYTSTVVDGIISGLVNLTLTQVVANTGNWSADMASYYTSTQTDSIISGLVNLSLTDITSGLTLASFTDNLGHVEDNQSFNVTLTDTLYLAIGENSTIARSGSDTVECSGTDQVYNITLITNTSGAYLAILCSAQGSGGGMSSWVAGNGSATATITDSEQINWTAGTGISIQLEGNKFIINSTVVDTDTWNTTAEMVAATNNTLNALRVACGNITGATSNLCTLTSGGGSGYTQWNASADDGGSILVTNGSLVNFTGAGTVSTTISGSNVVITGSAHTTDTDTNASTSCGADTFLGGSTDGCVDISGWDQDASDDVPDNTTFNQTLTDSLYEVQLNNEAGLYAVLSDVSQFWENGDSVTGAIGANEVYGSGWNGDTSVPEKDDIYDWGVVFDADSDGTLTDESWFDLDNIGGTNEAGLYGLLSDVSDFLQSLADDPTPQLGGVLDTNGHNITIATNVNVTFPGGYIYYNGSCVITVVGSTESGVC